MDSDQRKKVFRILLFLAALLLFYKIMQRNEEKTQLFQVTGQTMGTVPYNVKYLTTEGNYQAGIDSLLVAFNQSLSTYIPDSEISRFNKNDTLVHETPLFFPVLEESQRVFQVTEGAFDPTIGPLVNAWGFGPDEALLNMDSSRIDSLLQYVGFSKIDFNTQYAAKPDGMYLDFSAIAKGYAVDLVSQYLEKKGISDYMVEIGGEVRTLGKNEKGKVWAIGIEDPMVTMDQQEILAIVQLNNRAVATSGNYRNYYEEDGKIYAHIIDPRTGYTSDHNLLSASVLASTCMRADAYATAFMVMGLEKAKALVDQNEELDAIFVYRDTAGEIQTQITKGISESISLDKTK